MRASWRWASATYTFWPLGLAAPDQSTPMKRSKPPLNAHSAYPPMDGSLHLQTQEGPGGRLLAVGLVLGRQGVHSGRGACWMEHLYRAEELHPGEPLPVVLVVVHGQSRGGTAAQEAHPGRLPRALGLLIDGGPDGA